MQIFHKLLRHKVFIGLALVSCALPLFIIFHDTAHFKVWKLSVVAQKSQLLLSVNGQKILRAPRPDSNKGYWTILFYDDPVEPFPSRQALVRHNQLRGPVAIDTAGALAWELPWDDQVELQLEVRGLTDMALLLGQFGAANSQGFVIRPRFNDCALIERRHGQWGAMKAVGPLEPLNKARQVFELLRVLLKSLFGSLLWAGVAVLLCVMAGTGRPWRWRVHGAWAIFFAISASAFTALWGGQGVPHVSDEIAALFQAKAFAQLHWASSPPPDIEAFRMEHIVTWAGMWKSKYAPWWSLSLAPWQALGVAWVWPALLAGASVTLLRAFGRRSGGATQGAWAAALLALSPQLLLMSGTYFIHAAALFLACAWVWGLWEAVEGRETWPVLLRTRAIQRAWFLAGLSLAALAAMRPYSALCLGMAGAVWVGLVEPKGKNFLALGGVCLLALGAMALSNKLSSGAWSQSSYLLYDVNDRPGFGPEIGSYWTWGSPGHNAAKGLINARVYLNDLSARLLGWPWGLSLTLLWLNFILRRGGQRLDHLLGLCALFLIVGHFFYWCLDMRTLGCFYWYEALGCFAFLSARGALACMDTLKQNVGPGAESVVQGLVLVGAVWGLTVFQPAQVFGLRDFGGADARLRDVIALLRTTPALVLTQSPRAQIYHSAFALQDPSLRGPWVFARSQDPDKDAALARAFSGRRLLYWDGERMRTNRRP